MPRQLKTSALLFASAVPFACSLVRSVDDLLCPAADPNCDQRNSTQDSGIGMVGVGGAVPVSDSETIPPRTPDAGRSDAATPLFDAAASPPDVFEAKDGTGVVSEAGAPGLEVFYVSDNPEELIDAPRIGFKLRLVNRSREAVALDRITTRYFFTTESGGTQSYRCTDTTGSFRCADLTATVSEWAGEEANRALTLGFSGGAGKVAGDGAHTGTFQGIIQNTDFARFDQRNDYSFEPSYEELLAHPRVALYLDGVLVWGQEP